MAASGDLIQPLFPTLASVGYTACSHPRQLVNVSGELDSTLLRCLDCGAKNGDGGSLDYKREPWDPARCQS